MAFRYQRILCPIDFDNNSMAALDAAVDLAGQAGQVYLMHVVQMIMLGPETGGYIAAYDAESKAARKKLEAVAKEKLGSIKHEVRLAVGEPASAILAAIDKISPDLVVMATHGRKGVAHLFLGSVTERVVRESPKPVLTIRPLAQGRKSRARTKAPSASSRS